MESLSLLKSLLEQIPGRLHAISSSQAAEKRTMSAWSRKEELGHLLDSTANNHQRIVRAQLEDRLAMPGYEQNRWVAIHRYQDRAWPELIELWQALNRQLLSAAESVPEDAWTRTLTIANSDPLTLRFVFDDYLKHMLHHLKHIGIEVDDLARDSSGMTPSPSGAARMR
jgi:hypothetical protein